MDVSDGVNPPNSNRLGTGPHSSKRNSRGHNVLDLIRPFDPTSAHAEDEYNDIVDRLNDVRRARAANDRERLELERQFVEDDLTIRSGERIGQPLSLRGRRRRLRQLVEVSAAAQHLSTKERFLIRVLESMNEALDRWAREIYGL